MSTTALTLLHEVRHLTKSEYLDERRALELSREVRHCAVDLTPKQLEELHGAVTELSTRIESEYLALRDQVVQHNQTRRGTRGYLWSRTSRQSQRIDKKV